MTCRKCPRAITMRERALNDGLCSLCLEKALKAAAREAAKRNGK